MSYCSVHFVTVNLSVIVSMCVGDIWGWCVLPGTFSELTCVSGSVLFCVCVHHTYSSTDWPVLLLRLLACCQYFFLNGLKKFLKGELR